MSDGFTLEVDLTRAIARFDGLPDQIHDALVLKMGAIGLQLEAKIKGKLSGDVLNVQTGALRRSIFTTVEDNGRDSVKVAAGSSGDVKYAAIHEFGYVGPEVVHEHVRTISQVFGKAITPMSVTVKPFTRQMNMPERSFIRSSLEEMLPQIKQGMRDVVFATMMP